MAAIDEQRAKPAFVLNVERLEVKYGAVTAAQDVSLRVRPGEVVALLGPNGAGKTSVLKAIAGLIAPSAGTIEFFDGTATHRIDGVDAHRLAHLGIANVPAQHAVLPRMSVSENLEVGALFLDLDRREVRRRADELCAKFPMLGQRRAQFAGTLSGGEQRTLAVARALMSRPRLLLLDEPSLGLAPIPLKAIFTLLRRISREEGIEVLLVEQNVVKALEISDHAYVMRIGGVEFDGSSDQILAGGRLHKAYLGS